MRRTMWVRHGGIRAGNFHRPGATMVGGNPSPVFVPLTVLRGIAGVAFICFGEFFWLHLHRIGLAGEGKVLGWMALGLGSTMVLGAALGAAGISFSSDDGCRLPLLGAVYLSAPLALGDIVAAVILGAWRAQVLRLDREHAEDHPPKPEPGPNPGDEGDPSSSIESFRQVYDLFLLLTLAFSVLEVLMFRLGRRRLVEAGRGNNHGGTRLPSSPLQSLLDEEDLREAAIDRWEEREETVQQNLLRQHRFEQLRRTQLEKSEGLLEHTRGGHRNNSL